MVSRSARDALSSFPDKSFFFKSRRDIEITVIDTNLQKQFLAYYLQLEGQLSIYLQTHFFADDRIANHNFSPIAHVLFPRHLYRKTSRVCLGPYGKSSCACHVERGEILYLMSC